MVTICTSFSSNLLRSPWLELKAVASLFCLLNARNRRPKGIQNSWKCSSVSVPWTTCLACCTTGSIWWESVWSRVFQLWLKLLNSLTQLLILLSQWINQGRLIHWSGLLFWSGWFPSRFHSFHAKDIHFPALSTSPINCPWKCFRNRLWNCVLTDCMIWKVLPKLLLYVEEFNLLCLWPFCWRFTKYFFFNLNETIFMSTIFAAFIIIFNPPINFLWILGCHSDSNSNVQLPSTLTAWYWRVLYLVWCFTFVTVFSQNFLCQQLHTCVWADSGCLAVRNSSLKH